MPGRPIGHQGDGHQEQSKQPAVTPGRRRKFHQATALRRFLTIHKRVAHYFSHRVTTESCQKGARAVNAARTQKNGAGPQFLLILIEFERVILYKDEDDTGCHLEDLPGMQGIPGEDGDEVDEEKDGFKLRHGRLPLACLDGKNGCAAAMRKPAVMKNNSPERRVVITGMGVISPSGNDLETFWSNLRGGISAAAPVTRFDASRLPVKIAAEVKNFRRFGIYQEPETGAV